MSDAWNSVCDATKRPLKTAFGNFPGDPGQWGVRDLSIPTPHAAEARVQPNFSWDQSLARAEGASPFVRPTQGSPEWGRWALLDSYCKHPASTQTADGQVASFSLHWQSCLSSCCVRRESNIEAELLPFPGRFIHSIPNTAHKSLSPSIQGHGESVCFSLCQCWLYKGPP